MDQGTLEEKKTFLRAFVGRIKIYPGKGRGTVEYYKIPDLERLLAGKSSFKLGSGGWIRTNDLWVMNPLIAVNPAYLKPTELKVSTISRNSIWLTLY